MSRSKYLALFIFAVVGLGLIIGYLNVPGAWYAGLSKPWFNPPNWIFAPVWTVLYVLIAVVGWRSWFISMRADLKALWVTQMFLNFLWSPAFFGAEKPALGLVIILFLLATIVLFIVRARKVDPASTLMFLPYAAWVVFATLLNGAIVMLN
ncbi:TspO/MBR family protein [Paracoccus cavernae]|uniref:TspO/MBR family protein n=1 Tax=Paracoccus cavernae TaxID=1571207 RepID=A0ABT8D987_9RHOB|nr:TspO/MBR family protein [Paracoccus cavernae]